MITDYHAKYFAYELTKRCASDSLEKLSSTVIMLSKVSNVYEPIISQKQFYEAAVLFKRNRKNAVVKFKNNNYHLSGVLKFKE